MRLVDLSPVWLSPDMFAFKSPSGSEDWLTCKRVCLSYREQVGLIMKAGLLVAEGKTTITTIANVIWTFVGSDDFENMIVYPSLDFKASGNWHGFIINGEVRGI